MMKKSCKNSMSKTTLPKKAERDPRIEESPPSHSSLEQAADIAALKSIPSYKNHSKLISKEQVITQDSSEIVKRFFKH